MKKAVEKVKMSKDSWSAVEEPAREISSPVTLSPFAVLRGLLLVEGALLTANLTFIYFSQTMENSAFTWYLDYYFNYNGENNIPAFFSSIILVIASALLFLIYHTRSSLNPSSRKKYWLMLSIIFLFLAVDENVQIHEEVTKVVRPLLASDLSGFLHWAWVVPYFIAFLAIAAYFMSFVISLPIFTRNLIFIAGFLFVFGAVGLELVEGYMFKVYGLNHIYNKLLYCMEEFLEMTGVILFIFALLDYMARYNTRLFIERKSIASSSS